MTSIEVRTDVVYFIKDIQRWISKYLLSPFPIQFEVFYDVNASGEISNTSEKECDWNNTSQLSMKYSQVILSLLRVEFPKKLFDYLKELVDKTEELDQIVEKKSERLGFTIVKQAYERVLHYWIYKSSDLNEPMITGLGGGSGAGFQIYCDGKVLLSVGGGSGGGMELNYLQNGLNSFGGGGGGGVDFVMPETTNYKNHITHAGGGGGGGGEFLPFARVNKTSMIYHYAVDNTSDSQQSLLDARIAIRDKAIDCHREGRLWFEGGGGGGGGSQWGQDSFCGFGYGFTFHGGAVDSIVTSGNMSSSSGDPIVGTGDEAKGDVISQAYNHAVELCRGYEDWMCVCSESKQALIRKQITWARDINCDHTANSSLSLFMTNLFESPSFQNLVLKEKAQLIHRQSHGVMVFLVTLMSLFILKLITTWKRRKNYQIIQ